MKLTMAESRRTTDLIGKALLSLSMVFLSTAPAFAGDRWSIDSERSKIDFAIKNMVINKVTGNFSKVTGNVVYDGRTTENAAINASVDINTVDTKEPKRDEHLRNKDFFDVASYPVATFKSGKVTGKDGTSFVINGSLTLRGITKEVVLVAKKTVAEASAMHLVATTQLNRRDFGINFGPSAMIGDKVDLTLDIHLVKAVAIGGKSSRRFS
ncbi:MAG: YceI family protein [Candidatus Obscuribacterales bacterium]|nr:YceI family protein [Candidatus Obscuribacterales bacterium]